MQTFVTIYVIGLIITVVMIYLSFLIAKPDVIDLGQVVSCLILVSLGPIGVIGLFIVLIGEYPDTIVWRRKKVIRK